MALANSAPCLLLGCGCPVSLIDCSCVCNQTLSSELPSYVTNYVTNYATQLSR